MKRILSTLGAKWPGYLLQAIVIVGSVYGAMALWDARSDEEDAVEVEVGVPVELTSLPDPLAAGWEGESVCEVLEANEDLRVLKCVFPPGVGHEKHYHAPHTGYTLAGAKFQITDSTGTRTVNVPTGYAFGKEFYSVHEVLNVGETTGEFLIIEAKH